MDPTLLLIGALAVAGVAAAIPTLKIAKDWRPTGHTLSSDADNDNGRRPIGSEYGLIDDSDDIGSLSPIEPRGLTEIDKSMGYMMYNPLETDITRGGMLGHSDSHFHTSD